MAFLVADRGLWGARASVVPVCGLSIVVNQLSCSEACGTFLDQGSNPCLLHWQVNS